MAQAPKFFFLLCKHFSEALRQVKKQLFKVKFWNDLLCQGCQHLAGRVLREYLCDLLEPGQDLGTGGGSGLLTHLPPAAAQLPCQQFGNRILNRSFTVNISSVIGSNFRTKPEKILENLRLCSDNDLPELG